MIYKIMPKVMYKILYQYDLPKMIQKCSKSDVLIIMMSKSDEMISQSDVSSDV